MAKVSRKKFDDAMAGVAKIASNDDIIAHFMDLCSGPRAFAKMMFDQYMDPKCSPMVKARVLEMLLRSLKFAEAKRGNLDDLGLLNDEDLDREITSMLPTFVGEDESKCPHCGKVIHAAAS